MAKSRGNIIPLFGSPKQLQKAISRIVTDSKDFTQEPLDPEKDIVFKLYALVASPEEVEVLRKKYLDDRTFGYGHAKQLLGQKLTELFSEANQRYQESRIAGSRRRACAFHLFLSCSARRMFRVGCSKDAGREKI